MLKYERIKYPDDQISAKITEFEKPSEEWLFIRERINSYEDLMFIKSLSEIPYIRNERVWLDIPCLFGQRSDRRFHENQSFDLKIIAEILNSCNFQKIGILDPHSDVSLALINNSYKESPFQYIAKAYNDILQKEKIEPTLISPDAGAYKKVFEIGEKLNLPVLAAIKHRDDNGKIHMEFTSSVKDRICLIVDDICDGGATFINLAKKMRENRVGKVYLYVTHGYFSKGLEEITQYIDHIYCTNSVKDIENKIITQFKII